ncbi:MAG: stage V sporulation protein AC [Clostridia bacterium]
MISKNDYIKKANLSATKSPSVKNFFKAFLVGGIICVLGQIIFNITAYYFPNDTDIPKMITPMALIVISSLLTGFGVFDKIAKFAGAGSAVPITGFANAIVSPAMEFKKEGIVLGMSSKMFVIAGPVLVFGTLASVVYGIVYYFMNV